MMTLHICVQIGGDWQRQSADFQTSGKNAAAAARGGEGGGSRQSQSSKKKVIARQTCEW